jgi:hypothetical protein
VKKKLKDYGGMLQYYTFMRTKSKMKDFDAKFKEWWEVANKYFSKDLETHLTQYKVDERTYKYKLECIRKPF